MWLESAFKRAGGARRWKVKFGRLRETEGLEIRCGHDAIQRDQHSRQLRVGSSILSGGSDLALSPVHDVPL